MNRRKSNISAWSMLALTAVVAVLCVTVSVGAAYGRYREDVAGEMGIRARKPAQVHLVSGNNPEAEYIPGPAGWDDSTGVQTLAFMVSNVGADGQIPDATQEFYLRMAASLGAWDGESEQTVRLTWTQDTKSESVEATVTRIQPDTPLYAEFGEGWLFTFTDNKDRELLWSLEGGQKSAVPMQLTMENGQSVDTSLFKLQVVGMMTTD